MSEMAFMDNIETQCEACKGLRFSPEALQFQYNGLNIAEVMDLSVAAAAEFFAGTLIASKLQPLIDVGLSYLHLNQSLSTLSGGELQRMKMASLMRQQGVLFIIDEPTDGLHAKDVQHIIQLFHRMVDQGNTLYIIEHNMDVIRSADYVIELGPAAGQQGGEIIFLGTPDKLKDSKRSVTAEYI